MSKQIPVLCILGPTASGKTDLALYVAEKYNGEIINVDSAQVYKGMDIGTAKLDLATRQRIPHHLFDIREPHQTYSASEFYCDAKTLIREIQQRNKLPILAGGTMLYFKALFDGLADLPGADENVRLELEQKAHAIGWPAMHKELGEIDPRSAARIKPNDSQRIQRALEVFVISGKTLSELHDKQSHNPDEFNFLRVALIPQNRAQLHSDIEKRLRIMLENGFLDELVKLMKDKNFSRNNPAMRAVGYRQLLAYKYGEDDLNEAINKSIYATRQLAKRQLTWLRKIPNLFAIDHQKSDSKAVIDEYLNTKFLHSE